MVSARPLVRRFPTLAAVRSRLSALPPLPSSDRHSLATARALYSVGIVQAVVLVLYAYLAITTPSNSLFPGVQNLLWVPVFVAAIGLAMTVIGLLGSLSAPWLAGLINLPLALTALYVDGALVMLLLLAALLGSAGWLARCLVLDIGARNPDDF